MATRLEEELRDLVPQVRIETESNIATIDMKEDKILLNDSFEHDYVVSTSPSLGIEGDTMVGTVNVMVVNLYYADPDLLPISGFGYLIPRSVPFSENPELALGVIFGSSIAHGQEGLGTPGVTDGVRYGGGTKLTVMMGGHWWNDWKKDDLPDVQTAIEMAKAVVKRHLSITKRPVAAKAKMQWKAIPQYQVGYAKAMAEQHDRISEKYKGRLKVTGSYWQGAVGVADCIKNARKVSLDIYQGVDENTGLEQYKDYEGTGQWAEVMVGPEGEMIVGMPDTTKKESQIDI